MGWDGRASVHGDPDQRTAALAPLSHAHAARLGPGVGCAPPNYGERMSTSPDVAVVGGGIAGASVAYELAATRSVVLLEAEATLGSHSTARSAATWIPGHGVAAVRALITASGPRFGALAAELGAPPLLAPRPVLWTASDADGAGIARRAGRRACGRAGRARPRRPRRGPAPLPGAARDPRRGAHRDGGRRRRRRAARRLCARAARPGRHGPDVGPGGRAAPRRRGLAHRARGRRDAARRRDRRRGRGVGGRRRRAGRCAAARAHPATPDDRRGPGARARPAAATRRRAAADGVRRRWTAGTSRPTVRTCWCLRPTRPRSSPGTLAPTTSTWRSLWSGSRTSRDWGCARS